MVKITIHFENIRRYTSTKYIIIGTLAFSMKVEVVARQLRWLISLIIRACISAWLWEKNIYICLRTFVCIFELQLLLFLTLRLDVLINGSSSILCQSSFVITGMCWQRVEESYIWIVKLIWLNPIYIRHTPSSRLHFWDKR